MLIFGFGKMSHDPFIVFWGKFDKIFKCVTRSDNIFTTTVEYYDEIDDEKNSLNLYSFPLAPL